MYVTCEPSTVITHEESPAAIGADNESLLIRLASARIVDAAIADRGAATVLEYVSQTPVLVLTTRAEASVWRQVSASVTVMRLDMAHRTVSTSGESGKPDSRHAAAREAAAGGV
jgi:hypothetical protein